MNNYFLYVGSAYPHKNLDRLIGAIVLLNGDLTEPVVLKIASSRSVFTRRLEETIKKLGAEKFVELLGFVPDRDLDALYRKSVAFVFPSLSEGFGLPGLEAINSGTLLLASDIPVFKEIYEENAIYFDPFDVSSMVSAMEKALVMDSEEREEGIKKARDFANKYSWVKMARETLRIYEESGHSLRSG